ncbi:DUF3836 domain-containing protein [Bacteroidaceae bacterium HV4-6-C5C]|jgi:hypothetical protein|nr:DUF3836 domain-containing protein [Bacteroidaceae bacterium HV4-6-C5C]
MKTKVFLKSVVLSAIILLGAAIAKADNKNNLIYNSEERDGMMVGQTVYKMDGNNLANYMKYSYQYDEQKRMTESESMKWNTDKNTWENDLRIKYSYQGKSVTTTYYKWDTKKQTYILVPEMTVTMDDPNS